MLWSILIAAIPERYHSAHGLLHSLLETQAVARMQDVELLYLMDNRRRSVGAKRNALMAAATGEYVSFIDDDDAVAPDYVQKIYRAICKVRKSQEVEIIKDTKGITAMGGPIDGPADVICFNQKCTLVQQQLVHECSYSIAHWKDREPDKRRVLAPSDKPDTLLWSGPPAHTMVWRREIVKDIRFPEKNFGEDVDWVDVACERARNELVLNGEPLYYYNFDASRSATR